MLLCFFKCKRTLGQWWSPCDTQVQRHMLATLEENEQAVSISRSSLKTLTPQIREGKIVRNVKRRCGQVNFYFELLPNQNASNAPSSSRLGVVPVKVHKHFRSRNQSIPSAENQTAPLLLASWHLAALFDHFEKFEQNFKRLGCFSVCMKHKRKRPSSGVSPRLRL